MDEVERAERQKYAKGVLLRANVKHPTYPWSSDPDANSEENAQKTPYYWWYSFLKLNSDYRETCENGGKGKCEQLYNDFGNLFETSFEEFWAAKQHLFVDVSQDWQRNFREIGTDGFDDSEDEHELLNEEHIELVDAHDIEPLFDSRYAYLSIPINVSKSRLKAEFAAMLDRIKPAPLKRQKPESTVKYKLSRGYDVQALKRAYDALSLKELEPKLKKYEVAERIGMKLEDYGVDELGVASVATQRRSAGNIIHRYEQKAKQYIKAAATQFFPSGKPLKNSSSKNPTTPLTKKGNRK